MGISSIPAWERAQREFKPLPDDYKPAYSGKRRRKKKPEGIPRLRYCVPRRDNTILEKLCKNMALFAGHFSVKEETRGDVTVIIIETDTYAKSHRS